MKNLINYYYHIYPKKIFKKFDTIYFYEEDYKYCFVECERTIEDLDLLVEITNNLYSQNVMVHTFIKNINNTFFIIYNDITYVLLRINELNNENIAIKDIMLFNNILYTDSNSLYKQAWIERWSNQVDTFENQILEYNNEYSLLTNVFDYYIGLAENAISYLKTSEDIENEKLFLSHKRINYKMTYEEFYNPLNFLFDNKVRDMSEYIKSNFFKNNLDFSVIEKYINTCDTILTRRDIIHLYSRLLYPTYYFDFFEEVINNRKKEEEFVNYINLAIEYEYFLLDLYNFLNVKYKLEAIDWIVNLK